MPRHFLYPALFVAAVLVALCLLLSANFLPHVRLVLSMLAFVVMILGVFLLSPENRQALERHLTSSGRARKRLEAGIALAGNKQHLPASAAFTRAIAIDPRLASAYARRGICQHQLNKTEE
jgi:hypothetical protein